MMFSVDVLVAAVTFALGGGFALGVLAADRRTYRKRGDR